MALDYAAFLNNATPDAMLNTHWWKLRGDDLAGAVFGTTKYLQTNQSARTTQLLISTRLYGNLSLMGLNGLTYSKIASVTSSNTSRITYNVCQSAVDTAQAKMAKNKPKPLFLTSGGDYKLQRRAKKLTKFVEGVFYENDAYTLGAAVFRDAEVWGTGVVHVYSDAAERIKFERVIPSELYVDDVDGFYGNPRNIHRAKTVDRQVLIQMFPNKRKQILEASQAKPDDLGAYPTVSDEVTVVESWHLPSGPDAKDGFHSMCLSNGELTSGEYEHHYFPFVFFHWNKRLFGFWGQSLVEQLQPIQLEINKLLWVVQRSMHLQGSFKILLENGSKIVKEHMNNDIGAMVTYTGTPPQYVIPPMVQPEVYTHLETLTAKAFELAGISQLSAASIKPAGLDSGKALREYNDIESDRFMVVGQHYENLFTELAKVVVSQARSLYGKRSYVVKVPAKKFIETIDWKDVHMHEDSYVLKIYPVSALSDSPQDRLQDIQELMQAGIIDPEGGRRLLDYPDLEAENELSNAEQDWLHEVFDDIVDADLEKDALEDFYHPPEPFDNLMAARKLCLEYYARGKSQGLEEEKLDLFRRYLGQLDLLNQAAMPPTAPAVPPQGTPAPAPVSNLMPNAPGAQQQ